MGKNDDEKACYSCGEMGHMSTGCPQKRCFRCGRNRHYERECRAKTTASGEAIVNELETEEENIEQRDSQLVEAPYEPWALIVAASSASELEHREGCEVGACD